MRAPERSFVFYPAFNNPPDEHNPHGNDATGAFQPGAQAYRRLYEGMGKTVVMCQFDNHQPGPRRREQILNAMGIGAGDGWFDAIVYFGHGVRDHIVTAGFGPQTVASFNDAVWANGQYDVKVVLYACSCAEDNGIAARISESMYPWAQEGYRVFGHKVLGHAFRNPIVRHYPNSGSVSGAQTCPEGQGTAWRAALADSGSTLWARFPFMTTEEVAAELG